MNKKEVKLLIGKKVSWHRTLDKHRASCVNYSGMVQLWVIQAAPPCINNLLLSLTSDFSLSGLRLPVAMYSRRLAPPLSGLFCSSYQLWTKPSRSSSSKTIAGFSFGTGSRRSPSSGKGSCSMVLARSALKSAIALWVQLQ